MTDDEEVDANGPWYRVTEVAGRPPVSLDDLIGATTVTVEKHGHDDFLIGAGVKDGQAVLFHDKETGSARDSDPVWIFTDLGGGVIAAQPPVPD
jgi:hypothetical protein